MRVSSLGVEKCALMARGKWVGDQQRSWPTPPDGRSRRHVVRDGLMTSAGLLMPAGAVPDGVAADNANVMPAGDLMEINDLQEVTCRIP